MFGHPVPFPKRADSLLDLHFMVLVCFIVDLLDYGDDCDGSDNGSSDNDVHKSNEYHNKDNGIMVIIAVIIAIITMRIRIIIMAIKNIIYIS